MSNYKVKSITEAEIKEIYRSYSKSLELLTYRARSGCNIAARHLIKVMIEREITIQAFGWRSIDVDGEHSTFELMSNGELI